MRIKTMVQLVLVVATGILVAKGAAKGVEMAGYAALKKRREAFKQRVQEALEEEK